MRFTFSVLLFVLLACAANSVSAISGDKPNTDKTALLSLASATASQVMTFNYLDYQRRLQESSRLFTTEGWETFTAAMQRLHLVEESVKYQQSIYTHPSLLEPAQILAGGDNGHWTVQVPLVQVTSGGNAASYRNLSITMVVLERKAPPCCPDLVIERWEEHDD